MSLVVTDSEAIIDVAGNAIGADAAAFLKSIDRLMTVGTYYSLQHEQYRKASEQACAAMVAAIRPRRSLTVEIAAAGLVVDGHTLDPRLKVVRQFHDMLVSLNVAQIEITAELTAADLRQALAALQEHRLSLGQAQSFQEITIGNLPPSVSVASRRVGAAGGMHLLSPEDISDLLDAGVSASGAGSEAQDPAAYVREIMDLLRAAVANHRAGAGAAGRADAPLPTGEELAAFREGLQRLLALGPDAGTLAHLMTLARQAAALTADAGKARLIFEKLRQGVAPGAAPPEAVSETVFQPGSVDVGSLAARVEDLAGIPEAVAEPQSSARRDQLALGFRLLDAGLAPTTSGHVLEAMRETCRDPQVGPDEARVIAASLASLAAAGRHDVVDGVAVLLAEVRRSHPGLVAEIWSAVEADLDPAALAALWPHLVNDLLLGLAPAPDPVVARLCLLAGRLGIDEAVALAPRLAALPGVRAESPAEDIFHIAPARLRCVHAALLQPPAGADHGPRLHRALARRPLDDLTAAVVGATESYGPHCAPVFLALLREGGQGQASPHLRALATAYLAGAVEALPRAGRDRAWVPGALSWLGRLNPIAARPLLERVLSERRWPWRRAWPEACRQAARRALAAADGEV